MASAIDFRELMHSGVEHSSMNKIVPHVINHRVHWELIPKCCVNICIDVYSLSCVCRICTYIYLHKLLKWCWNLYLFQNHVPKSLLFSTPTVFPLHRLCLCLSQAHNIDNMERWWIFSNVLHRCVVGWNVAIWCAKLISQIFFIKKDRMKDSYQDKVEGNNIE